MAHDLMALSLCDQTLNTLNMELKHFQTLSKHDQLRNLMIDGLFVADRLEEDASVYLFQLPKTYTEVYFTLDGEQVLRSNSFTSLDGLEPYLKANQITNIQ
jgi:hypothetical protein